MLRVAFRFEKEAGRLVKAAPQALEQTLGAAQRKADLIRSLNPLGDLNLALAVVAPGCQARRRGFRETSGIRGPISDNAFSLTKPLDDRRGRTAARRRPRLPTARRTVTDAADERQRSTPHHRSRAGCGTGGCRRYRRFRGRLTSRRCGARPRMCRARARSRWARSRNVLPDRFRCRATRSRSCSAAAAWASCTRRGTWP